MICWHKLYHFTVANLVLPRRVSVCDRKMIQSMPANDSNTNRVITILLPSDKTHFQNDFVMLLRRVAKDVTSPLLSWHKRYDLNAEIFDVIANENARFKRNESEWQKGRDLTQSNDKGPFNNRNVKRVKWQHKQRHKKVRLHSGCGST